MNEQQPPSVLTTVLVTMFLGVFGLIPMCLGMSDARRVGAETGRYPIAFVITLIMMAGLAYAVNDQYHLF